MKEKYPKAHKLWPEVDWIKDAELKEKTLKVWEYALEHSPLTAEDLEEIH